MRYNREHHSLAPARCAALAALLAALLPAAAIAEPTQGPGAPVWGTHQATLWDSPRLFVAGHGVAVIPSGRFADDAAVAGGGGGGVGASWLFAAEHALRVGVTWTYSAFPARQDALEGSVAIHHTRLHADYVWRRRWWRPYAGVGLSVVPWSGRITQRQTGLYNASGFSVGAGGTVTAGIDLNLVHNLTVAPEASWSYIGGDFEAGFWQTGVVLRWEF